MRKVSFVRIYIYTLFYCVYVEKKQYLCIEFQKQMFNNLNFTTMTLSTALAGLAYTHRHQLLAALGPVVIPALPYVAAGAAVVAAGAGVVALIDKVTEK